MPVVQPAASKYLAQKWEQEKFRVHRNRVRNAITLLDMSSPKEFPHLKLAVNRKAIQDDRQQRYEHENLMLLKKIKVIVNGHGSVNNWNAHMKKDLHTAARLRQQREIEYQNELMLKRIQKAKPVVSKKHQEKDFRLHKRHKDLLANSIKDFPSPRRECKQSESESTSQPAQSETDDPSEGDEASDEIVNTDSEVKRENEEEGNGEGNNNEELPPLPKGKKVSNKPPPENRKKNRNAAVPKLPKI